MFSFVYLVLAMRSHALINADPSPKECIRSMAGIFESKGSSLGLKARNSKLPSISSHLSANVMIIESGDPLIHPDVLCY